MNSTIAHGNDAEVIPYEQPFGISTTIMSGIIIYFFFVAGVVLNIVTILTILCAKNVKSIFMIFIVSLSTSDLISALISPLFWYRRTLGFDVWMPPNFFCKLFWSVDMLASFSTSMHILSFAILRYLSISRAPFYSISKRTARFWILFMWCLASTCGFIPMWVFTGADPGVARNRTSEELNAKWPACTLLLETVRQYEKYSMVAYSVFFLLPMSVVIIFSILTGISVHRHAVNSIVTNDAAIKKRLEKERQALFQLTLIVISFLVGYIPFLSYELWSTVSTTDMVTDYWFGLVQYFFKRFSECMNPVFYNVGSIKMRKHTKKFLTKYCMCCISENNALKDCWNKPREQRAGIESLPDQSATRGSHADLR